MTTTVNNLNINSLNINNIATATSTSKILGYDTVSGNVLSVNTFPAITVKAATGTIALTPAMNRSTYILTGTYATQTFTVAGLTGEPAGFCVYLRNGNNLTGAPNDITITTPSGSTTLHDITPTTNSGFVLLYWTGSSLVAYK